MRAQKAKVLVIGLMALAGCVGVVQAAQLPAVVITLNDGTFAPEDGKFYGWMFRPTEDIWVTDLGLYDIGGDGLIGTWNVCIWKYVANGSGGFNVVPVISTTIGPIAGAPSEDGCHYVPVRDSEGQPILLTCVTSGTYERNYFVGFWFAGEPGAPREPLGLLWPSSVVLTADVPIEHRVEPPFYPVQASGTILSSGPWPRPTGAGSNLFGVNFKYARPGPSAEAGPDVTILSCQQGLDDEGTPLTTIAGTAAHTYSGTQMWYQWFDGGIVLQGRTPVTVFGTACLSLTAPVPLLSAGTHMLTLEVTDDVYTVSDTMTLTIANTPPEAVPAPASQVKNDTDPISVGAQLADFDGDQLSYTWREGDTVLGSGQAHPTAGGQPVSIPDLGFTPGQLTPGSHQIQLVVSDGVNASVTAVTTIQIVDTTMPTLSPKPDYTMLWPPDHALHSLRILANAADNSGGPIVLTASAASSEPEDDSGDGSTEVDCYVESADSVTGTVLVQLRAERSGTGEGRVYTITITATDLSQNQSTATVEVRVPHDKKKK